MTSDKSCDEDKRDYLPPSEGGYGNALLNLGLAGNKTANLQDFSTGGSFLLTSGIGNDTINIGAAAVPATSAIGLPNPVVGTFGLSANSAAILTDAGNDTVSIDHMTLAVDFLMSLGWGNDTANMNGDNLIGGHGTLFGGPGFDILNWNGTVLDPNHANGGWTVLGFEVVNGARN